MRGKINNELTILGDELYDWAKIYQSLIGYDEILIDKFISKSYKDKIINHFISSFHIVENIKFCPKIFNFVSIFIV